MVLMLTHPVLAAKREQERARERGRERVANTHRMP